MLTCAVTFSLYDCRYWNMNYVLLCCIYSPGRALDINTLRPRRNEQHFADDIFKRLFFNENVWISIKISLKFVPKGQINNIPPLVQIMAWRRSGDKPLSEPMMVSLPMHICVTRPQWVNIIWCRIYVRPSETTVLTCNLLLSKNLHHNIYIALYI